MDIYPRQTTSGFDSSSRSRPKSLKPDKSGQPQSLTSSTMAVESGYGIEVAKPDIETKKEGFANKKLENMQAKIEDLEAKLRASQEERKNLSQELKHIKNEKEKATKRAIIAEQKVKQEQEQGEKDRKLLEEAQKANKTLQKKMDAMQKAADIEKANKKAPSPDVNGLQCGLDRAKAQLKKKQEEFQAQALKLQQATAKTQGLEKSLEARNAIVQELRQRIERLEQIKEEEECDRNKERARMRAYVEKMNAFKAKQTQEMEVFKASAVSQFNAQRKAYNALFKENAELKQRLSNVAIQDKDIADRIRLRNLIDQAQSRLAAAAELEPLIGPDNLPNPSLTWRLSLTGVSLEEDPRIGHAKALFADKNLDEQDRAFVESTQAFRHACLFTSKFRKGGNDLHQLMERADYLLSVERHVEKHPADAEILFPMLDYVCPLTDSGTANKSDTPGDPGRPGEPGTPKEAGTPGEADTPEASGEFGTPTEPGASGEYRNPEAPGTPGTSSKPDTP
ncbi:hypothetical protein D9613_008541 [Agrocybe pediades]|uniref:Uncharacterized protein n=1 Tax=Agrocybe pediades TaxID=84607 RepID=A0A8H4QT99_9AGAR|nr:hypothetical protein D9613_008541 [Agrocybe pediades]